MDKLLLAMRALGPTRILALFLGIAAVIAILGSVAGNISKPGMTLLYGGLTPEEGSNMSQWLEGQGVSFEVRNDGSVYVPLDKVGELRLRAAGQGLVGSSTTGYEIFDKSSGFGTTSFVQNINARRALEGELSRTISSLPAVQGARVHLVIPQRRLFDQESGKPSAAVALNLAGRLLGQGQVENIARLVAASVPNLTIDSVTVIDQSGNMLFDGNKTSGGAGLMASRLQEGIEGNYEKSLVNMLEKVVGPGKVSVKVTATLNTDRIEEQSEIFNPEQQVVRSEQRSERTNNSQSSTPANTVGISGNIPDGDGGGAANSTTQDNDALTEETINYEISRTVRNLVREGGEIDRISVAVLLEGRYITQEGASEPTYQAYTEEDLDRFTTLVQTAIGYNAERGDTVEIIDMPFSQMPELETVEPPLLTKADIMQIVQYLIMLLGLVLVIFMIIRPALKAINSAITTIMPPPPPPPIAEPVAGASTAPMPGGAPGEASGSGTVNLDKVEGRVRESVIKEVNEIVDQHPEESLSVVRNWMADSDASNNNQNTES